MRALRLSVAHMLFFVLLFFGHESDAQLRNLRVCVPGYSPDFMYLFIAKDRGYFAQEKMNVDAIAARGQLCVTALMADQLKFSTNPNTFDLMVEGKLKAKVLFNAAKGLPHRLLVSPEIKNFGELKGKTIAISTFGGLTDKLMREILGKHNLQAMKDVFLLQVGTGDVRYASLKGKRVQGALLFGQYAETALEDGFRELEFEPPPYISSPLFATDETLSRERSMVRSFMRAALKGHLFFGQKADETIAVMQKVLRVEEKEVASKLYKDQMRRYAPEGRLDEQHLRLVTERERETRGIKRALDIGELFDLSFVAELDAELKKTKWKP